MTYQQLFSAIKAGSARGAYLFQGPEEYVKKSALEKLREALLPPGLEALNETALEGADAARIIESAETLPVMCDRRLVVVKDWGPLLSGKSKDEQSDAERMEAWLPRAPESCVIVFYVRGEVDKRKRASKAMEKYAQCVNFQLLGDAELYKWIQAQLKPRGKTMSASAIDALTFLAGRELTRLSGEVDKLAAYVQSAGEITEEDVKRTVTPGMESNVFLMIDSLMAKDAVKAYGILNAMLDAGENCVGILAMITRQMRLLAHVKLLRDEKLPLPEIEKRTALSHFVAQRVYGQCARIPARALEDGYRASVECDFAVKSGKIRDRAALDQMMMALFAIS